MSLSGEIITAFVAALGTIGSTVGLVAYLLRDLGTELKDEIQDLRTEVRSELRDEIGGLRIELRSDLRDEIGGLRNELRDEIGELRSEVRQVLVELLHHVQSGHHPPPQAA